MPAKKKKKKKKTMGHGRNVLPRDLPIHFLKKLHLPEIYSSVIIIVRLSLLDQILTQNNKKTNGTPL